MIPLFACSFSANTLLWSLGLAVTEWSFVQVDVFIPGGNQKNAISEPLGLNAQANTCHV